MNFDTGSSLLMDCFREEMANLSKKMKDPSLSKESGYPISYLSSFLPLDYKNGSHIVMDCFDGNNYSYDSLGIEEGSMVMVIGKTGSAKTTLVVQTAASIVQRFKNSCIIHEDIESGISIPRIKNITGWSSQMINSKYALRNAGISSETFFLRASTHCDQKMKMAMEFPQEMTYFTGTFDVQGNPVYKIIPSVIILDSLPLLNPSGQLEDSEVNGNMSGSIFARVKLS